MTDPHAFWTNGRRWPSPIIGYVFLAEAMHALGRARFPKSWTGEEPWGSTPLPLPRQQEYANNSDVARAYRLLGRNPLVLPMVGPPGSPPTFAPLDDASWSQAALKGAEESFAAAKAAGRWWDIKEITTQLFRIGGIKLFLRPYHGGNPEGPLDPSIWYTEEGRIEPRFGLGMMDMTFNPFIQIEYEPTSDPADPRFGKQDFRHMYVDRVSLDVALDVVTKVSPPHMSISDDEDEADPVAATVASQSEAPAPPAAPVIAEAAPSDSAALAGLLEVPSKKGRGRPKGSTNWDTTTFTDEYVRRLSDHGEPSTQNVDGWRTKEEAAETVLDIFYSGIDAKHEPPSISTAKSWATNALAAWQKAVVLARQEIQINQESQINHGPTESR